jgi:hypothetical protein
MEILESIAWITLGFAPVFGSMELAWRIHKKSEASKIKAKVKTGRRGVSPRIKVIG